MGNAGTRVWRTIRGSNLWMEGSIIRVQAYGGDSSYDLYKEGLNWIKLEITPDAEYFIRVYFLNRDPLNAGRFSSATEAASLAVVIMEAAASLASTIREG